MSCDSQNYTTRSAYDEHMLKMYHSPVWAQNEKTRTLYDLDLQKQYLNNTQRYVPNFPDNFKVRETVGQAPWNSFNNVMVKEGYAGNALCNTPRTMFDVDMINTYNTIGSNHRVVGNAPWSNFNNLDSQGNKVQFLCSSNVPMHHGGSAPMHHGGSAPMHHGGSAPMHRGGSAPMHRGGSAPMHRGGRHPAGGRGRGMDDGVSTRGMN